MILMHHEIKPCANSLLNSSVEGGNAARNKYSLTSKNR
jgi:hypothetical protein